MQRTWDEFKFPGQFLCNLYQIHLNNLCKTTSSTLLCTAFFIKCQCLYKISYGKYNRNQTWLHFTVAVLYMLYFTLTWYTNNI